MMFLSWVPLHEEVLVFIELSTNEGTQDLLKIGTTSYR